MERESLLKVQPTGGRENERATYPRVPTGVPSLVPGPSISLARRSLLEEFLERPPSQSSLGQPSFQERVVGLAPVPARRG